MYITCQQCSTIFRLDESLLKPTGSKVRCSQCKNVFVEYPPATDSEEPLSASALAAVTEAAGEPASEAAFDQELDDIDLDELDSMLDQGGGEDVSVLDDEFAEPAADTVDQSIDDLDEADLDMDFDLEIESESDQTDEEVTEISEADLDALDIDAEAELDTLDLEMDFEILSEEGEAKDVSKEQTEESSGELDLDDLDLEDMDFSLETDAAVEVAEADTVSPVEEDNDLGDLDLELEIDETEALPSEAAAEDIDDFNLEELDDLLDTEELDDLLDTDDTPETEAPVVETAKEDDELALEDDGEPLLEFDEAVDSPSTAVNEETDDFDLAELDDMLGTDDTVGRISAGKSRDAIDDTDELSLEDSSGEDLDAMTASSSGVEDVAEPDGLDLSDLDDMLDEVDNPTDQDEDVSDNSELELELELSSDDDNELEDLDFELDAEFEDKSIAKTDDAAADDDEIDLADIEEMLSDDDGALDTQQLEADFLGLDDEGGEKWAKGNAPELDLNDTDEIDLDEIEAAIDLADEEPVDSTIRTAEAEDEELSLDDGDNQNEGALELEDDLLLELDSDEEESEAAGTQEEDVELDLSDLDLSEDPESEDSEVIDAGDIELEFQIEDDEPDTEPQEDASVPADAREDNNQDFSIEDTVPMPEAAITMSDEDDVVAPVKAKKGGGKWFLILLILILVGGIGYVAYVVTYQGIEAVPVIGKILKPKPKDPAGILQLKTVEIKSKFVDSESSGRLFVIEGKVRNLYSDGRQMIRLQGKLFTKGKVLSKTEFAYAGVNISAQELTGTPVAELKKRLNSGIAQGGATKVDSGGTLPFVVVFSELPDQLDEFAIEVISSMPAK